MTPPLPLSTIRLQVHTCNPTILFIRSHVSGAHTRSKKYATYPKIKQTGGSARCVLEARYRQHGRRELHSAGGARSSRLASVSLGERRVAPCTSIHSALPVVVQPLRRDARSFSTCMMSISLLDARSCVTMPWLPHLVPQYPVAVGGIEHGR